MAGDHSDRAVVVQAQGEASAGVHAAVFPNVGKGASGVGLASADEEVGFFAPDSDCDPARCAGIGETF